MEFDLFGLVCSSTVFVCALLNFLKTKSRVMLALAIGFAFDNIVCVNNVALDWVAASNLTRAENIWSRKILFYLRVLTETPANLIITVASVILLLSIRKRRPAPTDTSGEINRLKV